MKKDIPFLPVEGVTMAVAQEKNELGETIWNVYLLNRNTYNLRNVLVTSKGYGSKVDGERQQTSVLRHHIPELEANEVAMIEMIDPSVFHLYNEYWVSYFVDEQVFDKKFIFVPESIIEENLIFIPQLSLKGILHT